MKALFTVAMVVSVVATTISTASAQNGQFQRFLKNNPGVANRVQTAFRNNPQLRTKVQNFAKNNPGVVNRVRTAVQNNPQLLKNPQSFLRNNPGVVNRVRTAVNNNPQLKSRVQTVLRNNPGVANRVKQVIQNSTPIRTQPVQRNNGPTKIQKAVRIAGAVTGVINAVRNNRPQVIVAQPVPRFVGTPAIIGQPVVTQPVITQPVVSQPAVTSTVVATTTALPTNTLPTQTFQITLLNPEENKATVSFNVAGETATLEPGYLTTLEVSEKTLIEFDRGGEFGSSRYKLENGSYRFKVSNDKGWQLFEMDETTVAAN